MDDTLREIVDYIPNLKFDDEDHHVEILVVRSTLASLET